MIGDTNAALSQEQLNIPQAEAEHMIQSDGMADDLVRTVWQTERLRCAVGE